MRTTRRDFLRQAAAVSLGFTGLQHCVTRASGAAAGGVGYGSLIADPDEILDLPKGFSYRVISRAGDKMSDGLFVPSKPDGMATFAGPKGRTILIRNHEVSSGANDKAGPFGKKHELLKKVRDEQRYDVGTRGNPCLGGTSTIVYDTDKQKVVRQFLSLSGTVRNCAGGPTPWNSWVTCEESVETPGVNCLKRHGYNFEVPATSKPELADPVPLKAMGRFNHEAIAVDPASGIVYETEDRQDSCIYRFIPKVPGKLAEGGRLQALAVTGRDSLDTRNWEEPFVSVGKPVNVHWIDIAEVDTEKDDLRYRAFDVGAARFARGEGMWQGEGAIFFACTSGGQKKKGQIWKYVPSVVEGQADEMARPGTLELFIEPNDSELVENADNLTVSPWGDLVVCEDGPGDQFLVGVTPAGDIYKLGHNHYTKSEFAGATFSPDGSTLFVNIQHDGLTLAITGPWKQRG